MGPTRRAAPLLTGLLLLSLWGPAASAQSSSEVTVNRVSGRDRFATAAAITEYGLLDYWEARDAAAGRRLSRRAFVVNGSAFPDALASAAASWGEAAVLPVLRSTAPPASLGATYDLRLDHFTGVGGEVVIQQPVLDRLEQEADRRCEDDSANCFVVNQRVFGADRYVTAALVGDLVARRDDFRGTVYIAAGLDFPDALAGGAAAAEEAALLLLNPPDSLHPSVDDFLRNLEPGRVVILGGTAAISHAVERELASRYAVERISGADRYETAVAISGERAAGPVDEILLATGTGFADALAAGPASAQLRAPLLLTAPDRLPEVVADEIARLRPCTITIVGGLAAVSAAVSDAAVAAAERGGASCD